MAPSGRLTEQRFISATWREQPWAFRAGQRGSAPDIEGRESDPLEWLRRPLARSGDDQQLGLEQPCFRDNRLGSARPESAGNGREDLHDKPAQTLHGSATLPAPMKNDKSESSNGVSGADDEFASHMHPGSRIRRQSHKTVGLNGTFGGE